VRILNVPTWSGSVGLFCFSQEWASSYTSKKKILEQGKKNSTRSFSSLLYLKPRVEREREYVDDPFTKKKPEKGWWSIWIWYSVLDCDQGGRHPIRESFRFSLSLSLSISTERMVRWDELREAQELSLSLSLSLSSRSQLSPSQLSLTMMKGWQINYEDNFFPFFLSSLSLSLLLVSRQEWGMKLLIKSHYRIRARKIGSWLKN